MNKVVWRFIAAVGVLLLRVWLRLSGAGMKEGTRVEIQSIIAEYQEKVSRGSHEA